MRSPILTECSPDDPMDLGASFMDTGKIYVHPSSEKALDAEGNFVGGPDETIMMRCLHCGHTFWYPK